MIRKMIMILQLHNSHLFIVEIEGTRKNQDIKHWGRFRDMKDIQEQMLERVDAEFERWLNP